MNREVKGKRCSGSVFVNDLYFIELKVEGMEINYVSK